MVHSKSQRAENRPPFVATRLSARHLEKDFVNTPRLLELEMKDKAVPPAAYRMEELSVAAAVISALGVCKLFLTSALANPI